jgi:hypothetical protein
MQYTAISHLLSNANFTELIPVTKPSKVTKFGINFIIGTGLDIIVLRIFNNADTQEYGFIIL